MAKETKPTKASPRLHPHLPPDPPEQPPTPAQQQVVSLSAVERALQLQQELEDLKAEAIKEMLDRRAALDNQLRQLGYQSSPSQVAPSLGVKRPYQQNPNAIKRCSICKIEGHDGRQHRQQGPNKRPFTREELTHFGLPTPEGQPAMVG